MKVQYENVTALYIAPTIRKMSLKYKAATKEDGHVNKWSAKRR